MNPLQPKDDFVRALKDCLTSAPKPRARCQRCGSELSFVMADFWVYGGSEFFCARLGLCPACDLRRRSEDADADDPTEEKRLAALTIQ